MSEVSGHYLPDEDATMVFGQRLAQALQQRDPREGMVIYLYGELGVGKTTLSRALIRGLGYHGPVKSPTYTLVEPYDFFDFPLYHFDLYRLSDPEEVEFLGVEDYFRAPAVCLIEWPEKGHGFLPSPDLEVRLLDRPGQSGRWVQWQPLSPAGARLSSALVAS